MSRSSLVSLPHFCCALPWNCFQLPSMRSQFMRYFSHQVGLCVFDAAASRVCATPQYRSGSRPAMKQKNMGVADRVADYAQKPALHEGRGMVAGRKVNVRIGDLVPSSRPRSLLCKLVAPIGMAWRPRLSPLAGMRRQPRTIGHLPTTCLRMSGNVKRHSAFSRRRGKELFKKQGDVNAKGACIPIAQDGSREADLLETSAARRTHIV